MDPREQGTGKTSVRPVPVVRTLLLLGLLVIALWLIYQARLAFLMFFASVVLAVVWGGLAHRVKRFLPGGYRVSLAAVGVLAAGVLALFSYFLGPTVVTEFNNLMKELPAAIERVQESPTLQRFTGDAGESEEPPDAGLIDLSGGFWPRFWMFASTMLDVLTALVLIVLVAAFLAANPQMYKKGVATIVPPEQRGRAHEFLETCGRALWHWLIGQATAMLIIGVLTTIGLTVIGMEYALALGLAAGLLQFVPYLGPFLSAVPALILAFAQSPNMALWVAGVYFVIQFLEGNFITPIVLKREAYLPPAVTLMSTVVMGFIFGPLGVVVATPLAVVFLVFYQVIYQRAILGAEAVAPGEKPD